jgi:hypothetical protein
MEFIKWETGEDQSWNTTYKMACDCFSIFLETESQMLCTKSNYPLLSLDKRYQVYLPSIYMARLRLISFIATYDHPLCWVYLLFQKVNNGYQTLINEEREEKSTVEICSKIKRGFVGFMLDYELKYRFENLGGRF